MNPEQIFGLVIPIVLFFVVIYFFIMRPEKKRRQQIYEMQSQLQKGNKVVSIGGIYGIIEDIKDDVITLTLASGAKLKLEKGAIKRIVNE